MLCRDFQYPLPPELIAQTPSPSRDGARLLVIDRASSALEHRQFADLPSFLRPGDVLVVNDTRVIPARLRGRKATTGGEFEVLLLEEISHFEWWTLLRPGKRVRPGSRLEFWDRNRAQSPLRGTVVEKNAEGWCHLRFEGVPDLRSALGALGEIPLPPYIHREGTGLHDEDWERYQTVYSRSEGSVAAPTAGLHFTPELLKSIRDLGVEVHPVTLHVGPGTFAPVKVENLEDHVMHQERFELSQATASAVNQAKDQRRRVIAVGTTSVRVLESVARKHHGRLVAGQGQTRLFLYPPAEFLIVDSLITNFHLPESTLLMLVSAFAAPGKHPEGRDLVLKAYAEAVRHRYRFFSYGDATLWL